MNNTSDSEQDPSTIGIISTRSSFRESYSTPGVSSTMLNLPSDPPIPTGNLGRELLSLGVLSGLDHPNSNRDLSSKQDIRIIKEKTRKKSIKADKKTGKKEEKSINYNDEEEEASSVDDTTYSVHINNGDITFQSSHEDIITDMALDLTGRRLATVSTDKVLAIWNRDNLGKWYRVARFKCHTGAVNRVAWAHPEFGQVLATCACDKSVHVWEAIHAKEEYENKRQKYPKWIRRAYLTDSRREVTDLVFSPKHMGLNIACVSAQGVVRIYDCPDTMDLSRWTLAHELRVFHGRGSTLAWSLSPIHRPMMVVGSDEILDERATEDERIVFYELKEREGKYARILSLKQWLPSIVTDIQFSPIFQADYHQVAVAAGDIFIINVEVPEQAFISDDYPERRPITKRSQYESTRIAQLGMGDLDKVWRVKFNLFGTAIAASSGDGTVRIFKSLSMNQWVQLVDVDEDDYLDEDYELSVYSKSSRRMLRIDFSD